MLPLTPGSTAGAAYGEVGKVAAQVSAVFGGEAVGLHFGVGSDQEVGDQVLSRPALHTISLENLWPRVSSSQSSEVFLSRPRVQPTTARIASSSKTGTARM